MPCIRWMGLYGSFTMPSSLNWELTQKQREVAAEWTTANKPFVAPKEKDRIFCGLLVKSRAVIRKLRYDALTAPNNGTLNFKRIPGNKINFQWYPSKVFEAICYPSYVGIVIIPERIHKTTFGYGDIYVEDHIFDLCTKLHVPLFQYTVVNNKPLIERI